MIVVKEILDRKEVIVADNPMTMFYVGYEGKRGYQFCNLFVTNEEADRVDVGYRFHLDRSNI